MKKTIVAAPKIEKPKTITEVLNGENTVKLGFTSSPVLLKVQKLDSGKLILYPKFFSQRRRLNELVGVNTGTSFIFIPDAFTLKEEEEGPFVVKMKNRRDGKISLTAIPHHSVIEQWENRINTDPRNAPKDLVFIKINDRWTGRSGDKGMFIVPIKNMVIQEDLDNPGHSIPYNNLKMRPALTACILIAGEERAIRDMDTSGLTLYDEEMAKANEGPLYQYADEFKLFNTMYTAQEILGDPIGKDCEKIRIGNLMDLTEFDRNVETLSAKGLLWIRRTVYKILHADLRGTSYAKMLEHIIANSGNAVLDENFIKDAITHTSFEEVGDMCEETMVETNRALTEFKKWSLWAKSEIAIRNKTGLSMRMPQPHGRPAKEGVLTDLEPEIVANMVLDVIKKQISQNLTKGTDGLKEIEKPVQKTQEGLTANEKVIYTNMLKNKLAMADQKPTPASTPLKVKMPKKVLLPNQVPKQSFEEKYKRTPKLPKADGGQPVEASNGHVKVQETVWGVSNAQDRPTIGLVLGDQLAEFSAHLGCTTTAVAEPLPANEILIEPAKKKGKLEIDCPGCLTKLSHTRKQWTNGIDCPKCHKHYTLKDVEDEN